MIVSGEEPHLCSNRHWEVYRNLDYTMWVVSLEGLPALFQSLLSPCPRRINENEWGFWEMLKGIVVGEGNRVRYTVEFGVVLTHVRACVVQFIADDLRDVALSGKGDAVSTTS